MKKMNIKLIISAVVISTAFIFSACDNKSEKEESTVNNITWHEIMTVTRSEETMSSYTGTDSTERAQVNVVVKNIPSDLTDSYGKNLVMAGYELTTSDGTSYSWNNNETGNIEGTSLVSTVSEEGSASFTFYWNTTYQTTDFKIFADKTWNTIAYDPETSDYNIDIEFGDLNVKAGDILTVTIDATNFVDLN